MTKSQQVAAERNWMKARLLGARTTLMRRGTVWKNPETSDRLDDAFEALSEAIAHEWPEWSLCGRVGWRDISDEREAILTRAYCRKVLAEHGYAWSPKQLYALQQTAAYLEDGGK